MHFTGRTHSERMIVTANIPISPGQHATLDLLAENKMHAYLWGYNPHSMAIIAECYDDHRFNEGWDATFRLPIFTVITATGQTYCPYS